MGKQILVLSHKTHLLVSVTCVSVTMLHSLSNVTFPNHLARLAKSTQIFANSISSRSADNLGRRRCKPHSGLQLQLENVQTTRFSPRCFLMICGATGSQECDCVHLCQRTGPGLCPNQLWGEPEVGSEPREAQFYKSPHLSRRPPSIHLSHHPHLHPHSNSHWLLSPGAE